MMTRRQQFAQTISFICIAALSPQIHADEQDVRIGRYQTVTVQSPSSTQAIDRPPCVDVALSPAVVEGAESIDRATNADTPNDDDSHAPDVD